jgi:hypothetical protein
VPGVPPTVGTRVPADLARGYVKDPADRDAQVAVVSGWQADVERLRHALTEP